MSRHSSGQKKVPARTTPKSQTASTLLRGASEVTQRAAATPSLFPVVGIGASAGGLSAVTDLLKHLPRDIEAAVVVIQHLDPEHESLTAEILSRISPLPVSEVTDGIRVERGRVYVIPPNYGLRLSDGLLKLSPRTKERQHLPIDLFFESLAEERKDLAIGVVLSGIASDGTTGVQAIKAAGGFTFAQDPCTAQYDGMPRSAIASGAIDTVNSPDQIANDIAAMTRPSSGPPAGTVIRKLSLAQLKPDGALRQIFASIRKATGVDFTHYKHTTVRRRIGRRLSLQKIEHLKTYARYLETHPEEVKALFADILIHVTGFFRDPEAYEALKTRILPKYLETCAPGVPFRIWVPGCSSGEEAYSIAMVFFEVLDKAKVRPKLQLFASDISEASLQKARAAVYPDSITKDVSRERLKRFFERVEGGGYRVAKWIRETCLFSKHDLTADPPFAKVDLISCRNVLIYFGSELQKRVVPILHYALNPGGMFWLGRSETITEFSGFFALQDRANKFYVKKNVTAPLRLRFPVGRKVSSAPSVPGVAFGSPTTLQEVLRESDRAAIREYSPPGVVIDDSLEILNVHGQLTPYLGLAPGRATLNLLKLAHPEIVFHLRSLIDAVRKENAAVKTTGLTLKKDGKPITFGIKIVPLSWGPRFKERYFSIFFEEPIRLTSAQGQVSRFRAERVRPKKGRRPILDQHANEALLEQYEATQEELTASNEELQSTNEELQSTNEELETAKEELQSANEEMTTINDELQTRNTETVQLANDLTNLLTSLDTPIVMVGPDSRIRRFTPKAGQLLKLIPGDVGRRIGDIKPGFQAPDLNELTVEVMTSLTVKELETQDKLGAWYCLQVRPYLTIDHRIDGAVFMLTDITALKRVAEVLTIARDDAKNIIETMPNPILVIASNSRVQAANGAYYRLFQAEPSETEGKLLSELCEGSWNIPSLREKLEDVLRTGTAFIDFEIEHDFPGVGHKNMVVHATATRLTGAGTNTALLAIDDRTARLRAAEQLRHAVENYRLLLENAHDGVLIVDQRGVIEFTNRRLEEMFGYAPGELSTKPYELLIPDLYTEVHQKHYAAFMRDPEARDMGKGVDVFGKRKDGTIIPLEISLSPAQMDSKVVFTAIIRDISARKKIEEERQDLLARETEARRDAERANRVKDEFLATLSHELRTPLTTILTWAQILRLKSANMDQAKKGAAAIEKSAKDQGQLIEDLLDVSRIQEGKVRLVLREIEPIESITAALDSVRTQADDKSITIQTEFDPSPCRIVADSGRLEQVFRNLLTNAVKFTSPGGTITVQSRKLKDPGRLEIQVRDTGKGIRADFLPYIFKRFSQEDASPKREFGGLGLGLSIVWNLVEMHGGTVTADSPGEGQGAVFTVTLPRPGAGLRQEVVARAGDPQGTARDEEPHELDGLRVLAIDDQEDSREALSTVLESLGARVHLAGSAAEGLAALASDHPDVVLCDLAMPGEDGFSVIRKVRALGPDQGGKVPVVALTAYADRETVQRCLDAGFDAHLPKPMEAADLARLIVELTGRPKGKL